MLSLAVSLFAAVFLAAGLFPQMRMTRFESAAHAIASRTRWMILLLPLSSLIVNSCIAIQNGIPQPHVQDEFSYLLAADTFSHGRLTNPTPKFFEHFETPHELMVPTYMSKYPPAQGLVLAIGNLTTGMPIVGVWITTAITCGCLYWMLLQCVSPVWALTGGLLAVLHPELLHWSQVYWGGSAAALGASLVLCAWITLQKKLAPLPALLPAPLPALLPAPLPALLPALLLGTGLAILANSRPFEGLIFAVPLMIQLLFCRKMNLICASWLCVILIPVAVWMAFYNQRITGHILQMPFSAYSQQYDIYPKFWFLNKHAEPVFHNESMRQIHEVFEHGDYDQLRTLKGFFRITANRFWTLLTVVATPIILALPLAWGVLTSLRRMPSLNVTLGIFSIGLFAENFFLPHYAAPVFPLLLLLTVIGWQALPRILSLAIVPGFLVASLVAISAPLDRDTQRIGQHELIAQTAELQTGRHLILVSYTPDHLIHDEWVYNAADLESSRVIWARELGSTSDQSMLNYFRDRKIWNLTVGRNVLQLNAHR